MCILQIFIFSFVYTTPNLFIRGIHKMEINGSSRTVYEFSTSDDYINSDIPTIDSVCFMSVLIVMYVY